MNTLPCAEGNRRRAGVRSDLPDDAGDVGRVVARRRGAATGLIDTTVLRTVDRTDQVQTSEAGEEQVGVV
jgi:hypothetical protein